MATLKEPTEREIITIMLKHFKRRDRPSIPYGDDVSAIDLGDGRLGVLKCDMLVGKTDMPPGMSFRQAGRKAVVNTVSDMASKGVRPKALMVSLGIPRGLTHGDIEQLALGLKGGASEYGAVIMGGDTNESDDIVIDCVGFGVAKKGSLMLRSGARPGDLVAVTGSFGETSSGFKILFENSKASRAQRARFLKAVYEPKAQLKEGLRLARSGVVTSSIDSSDGLAWSLHEVATASRVGIQLHRLPVSKAVIEFSKANGYDPAELALYGGEEFILVLTIKPQGLSKAVEAVGRKLKVVGRVTDEAGKVYLASKEGVMPIEARGWQHLVRA